MSTPTNPDLAPFLEAAQLSSAKQTKLPRRTLSRGTLALLILLRVYVILALPVVAYAFIHALTLPQH